MGRRFRSAVAGALLLASALAGCGSSAAQPARQVKQYHLGAAFTLSANPSGVWSAGYATQAMLAGGAFQLDSAPVDLSPVGFWHPSEAVYYPYVAGNLTSATTTDATGSWALRPDEIGMEGSADGLYSVVAFLAPAAGTYRVDAAFAGIHFRHSTTDAHVLLNAVHLMDADIDGYGGDPAFHALDGDAARAVYQGAQALQAGDVLIFALGPGADGNNANDTTGLMVDIEAPD